MSFEPRLIINKTDLETHRQEISRMVWSGGKPDTIAPYKFLLHVIENDSSNIQFGDFSLVIVHPEGTEFNRRVRSILNNLNIEFQQDY